MSNTLLPQRFRLRILFLVLIPVVLTAVPNLVLTAMRPRLVRRVERLLHKKVIVSRIGYSFPDRIFFEDARVYDDEAVPGSEVFAIQKMIVGFSFVQSVGKFSPQISRLSLFGARTDYAIFKRKAGYLSTLIKQLPKTGLVFEAENFSLTFSADGRPVRLVPLDFTIRTTEDRVRVTGRIQTPMDVGQGLSFDEIPESPSLAFSMNGIWKGDELTVEGIKLERDRFFARLWGRWQKGRLGLQGFCLWNASSPGQKQRGRGAEPEKKAFLEGGKKTGLKGDFLHADAYVLDINLSAVIDAGGMVIDPSFLTLGKIPVRFEGRADDTNGVQLILQFFPSRSDIDDLRSIERIDVELRGAGHPGGYLWDGEADLTYSPQTSRPSGLERIHGCFRSLAFAFHPGDALSEWHWQGDLAFWTNGHPHRISWDDMSILMNLNRSGLKAGHVKAGLYDGWLDGEFRLDTTHRPFAVTAKADFHNLQANPLQELLVYFGKMEGRIDGNLSYVSTPDSELKGTLTVKNGRLMNYSFFMWLADHFDMPSVREFDFNNACVDFLVNSGEAGLTGLELDADRLRLTGAFTVKKGDLVSSKLNLSLSRVLLNESGKFRPIIGMFEPEREFFDFPFQLSGDLDAMNFYWLPSEVKKRVQERVPDFIERRIERKVGGM